MEGTSGHSSIPPKTSSIGTLGRALGRLEENPQPNLFGKGPEMDFFASLAPFVPTLIHIQLNFEVLNK